MRGLCISDNRRFMKQPGGYDISHPEKRTSAI
jgi:hypothetical protein